MLNLSLALGYEECFSSLWFVFPVVCLGFVFICLLVFDCFFVVLFLFLPLKS